MGSKSFNSSGKCTFVLYRLVCLGLNRGMPCVGDWQTHEDGSVGEW